MPDESAAQSAPTVIRGSGGLFGRNQSVAVSHDSIHIIKKSGEPRTSCSLNDAKLVECNYWEILLPGRRESWLTLRLFDGDGSAIRFADETTEVRIENFSTSDVQRTAEAIASLRPDLLVVRSTFPASAKALVQPRPAPPAADVKCPHCQLMTPISEALWKVLLVRRVNKGTQNVKIIKTIPTDEMYCEHCKKVVTMAELFPEPEQKGCFIATAALGSASCEQVAVLQKFRDERLQTTRLGRWLIVNYYRISPPIAAAITRHLFFRALVRNLLILPMAAIVSKLKLGNSRTKS